MLKGHEWRRCALLLLLILVSACHTTKRAVSNNGKADIPTTAKEAKPVTERNVRERYASMMHVLPSHISNIELYHFIDHWYSAPYKWGGNETTGVDCSGFVCALYRDVYQKKLARNSEQIYLTNCIERPFQDLHEGDLLFFIVDGDRINHVGLYLQNDFFVHATSSRGVVIDRLSDSYWSKKLLRAGWVRE